MTHTFQISTGEYTFDATINSSKVAVVALPREEKQRAIRKSWHI